MHGCCAPLNFSPLVSPHPLTPGDLNLLWFSHFLPLAQILIIAELTGLERGSGLKLFSTYRGYDSFYRFREGTNRLFRREIIDHLIVFDVAERCPLREFPEHFLNGKAIEVELDVIGHRILREGSGF